MRAAAAVSAVAVVAACSSASSGGAIPASPRTAGTASAGASSFDKASARQTAHAALLTLADFPGTWTATDSGDAGGSGMVRRLARCLHLPKSYFDSAEEAEAESPDFSAPHGRPETASESIDIGTQAAIDRDFEIVHSPELTECLTQVFTGLIARQSARHQGARAPRFGHPVAYRKSFANLADETDAIRLEIPVSKKRFSARFYFDLVFIRDGNASIQLFFENVFAPFDVLRELKLARLAAARLDAARRTATIASR